MTRIDFAKIQEQQVNIQVVNDDGASKKQYMDMLQKVAGSQEVTSMISDLKKQASTPKVYQDED